MDHIAIMKKSLGMTEKILSGEKKIESRWYAVKYRPWDRVKAGETVYFKDSGGPLKARAEVSKVLQFVNLKPGKVKEILKKYGKAVGISKEKITEFFKMFKNKKYCMLIFLKNPTPIKPFEIDKTGFGAMSAWITVDEVFKIKK